MALYSRGQARRSLIDTVAFRVISQTATILGYVVMVRGMSKEDFGVFNLLYAVVPVVSTVGSFGLEHTLRRFQPEYLSVGDTAAATWLVRFVASARFGATLFVLGIILSFWNHAAPFFKLTAYRAEFLILCLLVVVHFQARVLELSLSAHMLQRVSVGASAVVAVVKLAAYSVLGWMDALTLELALIVDTVAIAVAYLVLLFFHRRHCVSNVQTAHFGPNAVERRRLVRYGVFNSFNEAGGLFLDSNTDNFFIAALLDTGSVGIYSFYTRLNDMAQNLLPARLFQNVIQPLFFAVPPADAERKVPLYFSFLVNLNLVWQWPVLAFTIAYHAEIVQVFFGGKFIEHSWMLPTICAFAFCNVIEWPVTLVAQYQERAGVMLLSKIFAIYNIAALLLLIPAFGIGGAAIASGSAQAMKYAFIWWRVRRLARWTNARMALLASITLWSGVVLTCQLMKPLSVGRPIISLGVGVVVVIAALLVHVRGPALAGADRAILASLVRDNEAGILRRIGLLRGAGTHREHT